jgi:hypothetical protein
VHRQSVSRWQHQLKQQGLAGLRKAGRAGRRPKLSSDQLLELESELLKGPKSLGYSTELWTTQRIADLIRRRFRLSIIVIISVVCWPSWAGAVSGPRAGPWNGIKPPSNAGNGSNGPALKKSPTAEGHYRLCGRMRPQPASAPGANLGSPGQDAGLAVSLQLEEPFGHGGHDVCQLLLPSL